MTTPAPEPDRTPSTTSKLDPLERELLDRCTRCLRLRGSCVPEASTCDDGLVAAKLPVAPDEHRRAA
jgi:hypothetical protein